MELLDIYLPHYHFRERHALDIRATAAQVMGAVESYDSTEDRLVRAMTALREMPQRLIWRLGNAPASNRPPFSLENFTNLRTIPDKALALGLAGRFWKLDYGQEIVPDAESFKHFEQPGAARLVLGFSANELGDGLTRLVTETRVQCLDAVALRQFRPYWYLIRPFSGLIRRRVLKAIKQEVCRIHR
ncbi:hypothetical protein [Pseudomonas sp. CFBP 8772]|uniref:hypothetical protein n=1 Tax=Pseudomonas sp. CFBP 8772 TaxID=2775284 RepID=UPI001782BF3C|nr:hypothetical protein [Pseudomonas sp. CFBP 8772]MBD8599012.1 hypothetical protein [Pseudomonas sp. CFBP 8772]